MFAITRAAADLKTVAPEQYAKLVAAFIELEARYAKDFLAAEPNVIFASQGKAWVIAQLRARLERCHEQKYQVESRV